MKNSFKKAACLAGAALLSASVPATGMSAPAAGGGGVWVAGDPNTRTYLSDGGKTAEEVAALARANGLDWIGFADTGGGEAGTRDQSGTAWEDGAAPRWSTISGVGEDEIGKARAAITAISGFGWNVPAHGSATVGLAGSSADAKKELAVFDYLFDAQMEVKEDTVEWLKDLSRGLDGKETNTKRTNNTHMGAVRAAAEAGRSFGTSGYILVSSPSKDGTFKAADLKEFYDEAPDVFFGAEMLGTAQAWTYGGADPMLSAVGGAWDTLLSEGRRFWVFGGSGYNGTGPAPGEAVKNYTWAKSKGAQDVIDGMRSGNSFTATGGLITALDYKISNNNVSAAMGGTLSQITGKATTVTVRFKAGKTVDHIDLIAGEVKGAPEDLNKYAQKPEDFENPDDYLTDEYKNAAVTGTTKVVKTFEKSEFKADGGGYTSVSFTLPASDKNMYYRLRGTNSAKGSANCDANGNPTADSAAKTDDFWFYSNPVFVAAGTDGVTVSGVLNGADGKPLAGKTIETETGAQAVTDENGKFLFENLAMGIHTFTVTDGGGVLGEMTFNLQRGAKTEFAQGDVWIAAGAYEIDLAFSLNGEMAIAKVSDRLPEAGAGQETDDENNPKTGGGNITGVILTAVFALIAAVSPMTFKKRENA